MSIFVRNMFPKDYKNTTLQIFYLMFIASTWSRPLRHALKHQGRSLTPQNFFISRKLPLLSSKSRSTVNPTWLAPCAGSSEPLKILRGESVDIMANDIADDIQEIGRMTKAQVNMIQKLKNIYIEDVFRENIDHIRHLNRAEYVLSGLRIYRHAPQRFSSLAKLQHIYKQLIKVAILVHLIRENHQEAEHLHTDTDLKISQFLNDVEHEDKSGIYQILCKLKNMLANYDALPNVPDYGSMQDHLTGSTSKAERQNKAFVIINNILMTLKRTLFSLQMPAYQKSGGRKFKKNCTRCLPDLNS